MADLERAGLVNRVGKGGHRNFEELCDIGTRFRQHDAARRVSAAARRSDHGPA